MTSTFSRRTLLKLGLLSGAGLVASDFAYASLKDRTESLITAEPFQRPLQIPPVLNPVRSDATTDYYELTLQRSSLPYFSNQATETWSYNGMVPGPIIRQVGGPDPEVRRQSIVRVTNNLDRDDRGELIQTVLHLHGMGALAQYDGYATDFVAPNQSKDYHYPNDRAGTLWYHDHVMDLTARNVNMGLAGFYIVEDPREAELNLPTGDYDIPLLIQRKQFSKKGGFLLNRAKSDPDLEGEYTLVNGIPLPYFKVEPRKYRFRLLNASPVRHFQIAVSRSRNRLTSNEPLTVIGSDGGLLSEPVTLANSAQQPLPLGIGERYDVIIDFSRYAPGDEVYLHRVLNTVDTAGQVRARAEFQRIMRFDVNESAALETVDNDLPIQLRTIEPLATLANADNLTQRTFVFNREKTGDRRWTINEQVFDTERIDAEIKSGSVEIWTLINPLDDVTHPVHLHLVEGQLLERNGQPPRPYERGLKDVFVLGPEETLRVAFRFDSQALEQVAGIFMMHCHQLIHEDRGMMGQFKVIA
ncbi:MAG: multicopper oxidase family protein [Cyanobacteria bacterium J06642_2]